MRILIVEDERPTAEDIAFLVRELLGTEITMLHMEHTLENALIFLKEKTIDVLLLDLNLNAKDGFQILQQLVSRSFHTIIISANIHRAIEAFEYGVLDFIPKPYSSERLQIAFNRLKDNHATDGHAIKYLSVKRGFDIHLIPLEDIRYFKSDNIYVELHLRDGGVAIYDKPLGQLEPLLPARYSRIHKSYIINVDHIASFQNLGGGQYRVILETGDVLPVSRYCFKELKDDLTI
ncbi:MAG: LytTR family DNA-binding domain-containing protein [Ignavibacteria bacterium]|nr:LytTR family DNA-binding domain-containing protein [Ignavibacteria bacterium]